MAPPNRIIIVEKDTLIREALRLLISSIGGVEIIGQSKAGEEAVKLIAELVPDLVVMGLDIPDINGITTLHAIKRQCPGVRVLLLSAYDDDEHIKASLIAGCNGYLLKDDSPDELVMAIRTILTGEVYLDTTARKRVLEGYLRGGKSTPQGLSKRERQILGLIREGQRSWEIAKALDISSSTVEKHRANIMKKLDVHSLPALLTVSFNQEISMLRERRAPRPHK